MQLFWCLLSNFYLNMIRASLCPSSGEQKCALPHMVFWLCWLWLCGAGTFTVHTARVPVPHNHSHHNQCRSPYAAVHTLFLLMMGIMMPETCWDKGLIINVTLVASWWYLSLHPILSFAATLHFYWDFVYLCLSSMWIGVQPVARGFRYGGNLYSLHGAETFLRS